MPQAGSQMVVSGPGRITSTMAWISGRGVKYWPGAGLHVLGVALQQRLVGVALHVGAEAVPVLAVDEVMHQPGQHGRFLDAALRLAEDDPQRARLPRQRFQRAPVVGLQLRRRRVPAGWASRSPREWAAAGSRAAW